MRLPTVIFTLFLSSCATSIAPNAGTPSSPSTGCTQFEPIEKHPNKVDISTPVDIIELYKALQAIVAPKDEFETTAQHEERKARLWQETKIDGHALTDTFMVIAPISRDAFHYDADLQTVRIEHMLGTSNVPFGMQYPTESMPPHLVYEDPFSSDIRSLELKYESEDGRSYEASNAYGRKTTVQVAYATEYNLVLMNVRGNIQCEMQHVQFQTSPSHARNLQDNLAAVVRFDLRRPYAVKSTFHVEPKIDQPIEIFTAEHNIIGRAFEVYLVEKNTGQVIRAFQLN